MASFAKGSLPQDKTRYIPDRPPRGQLVSVAEQNSSVYVADSCAAYTLSGHPCPAGDLTPNNILLVENEEDELRPFRVKVSDFGLSRTHDTESALSTNTFGTVRCRAGFGTTWAGQVLLPSPHCAAVRQF